MDATTPIPSATVKADASQDVKTRPIKSFWEDDVCVSIWARDRVSRGEKLTFYTMTFQRRWLDDKEKARYSDSFELHHMASMMRLAKLAQSYVEPILYPELAKKPE